MKISAIRNSNSLCSFRAKEYQKNKNINFSQKPVVDGINTAGAWFGFGVALDFVTRKVSFSQSPVKNSLAINGIIAGVAGVCTLISSSRKNQN